MTQSIVTAPSDLLAYKPTRDTYSISWRINPTTGEILDGFDCEVQMDTESSFDSNNLRHITRHSKKNFKLSGWLFLQSFFI